MKRMFSIFSAAMLSITAMAQTTIIDYTERTEENTAAIHVMETKQTIESEEFESVLAAKTKLVRIIDNYRTDGFEVKSSNVTTHKHRKGYHYHYQYILQKDVASEGSAEASPQPKGRHHELQEKIKSSGSVKMTSPPKGLVPPSNRSTKPAPSERPDK